MKQGRSSHYLWFILRGEGQPLTTCKSMDKLYKEAENDPRVLTIEVAIYKHQEVRYLLELHHRVVQPILISKIGSMNVPEQIAISVDVLNRSSASGRHGVRRTAVRAILDHQS